MEKRIYTTMVIGFLIMIAGAWLSHAVNAMLGFLCLVGAMLVWAGMFAIARLTHPD